MSKKFCRSVTTVKSNKILQKNPDTVGDNKNGDKLVAIQLYTVCPKDALPQC